MLQKNFNLLVGVEKIMNEMWVRDDIESLIKQLNISRDEFHEVNKLQWEDVIKNVVNAFVHIRHYTHNTDLHWAWENFKEPRMNLRFANDDGYKYVADIIDDTSIWFIAEDYRNKMWVYEGKLPTILSIIPETTYLNEYYIVSKKYEWIICENHHSILLGSGIKIVEKMSKFKEKFPNVLFE